MVALIGNTPMVELSTYRYYNTRIYAKLEGISVGGSIKDRIGHWLIWDAIQKGLLTIVPEGQTIIEATSGNTGVGLAIASQYYHYPCKLLVPKSTAKEKISMMKAYGAIVEIIDGTIDDCIGLVESMSAKSNYVWLNQFDNPISVTCHELTTAPEIYEYMSTQTDRFLNNCKNIVVCAMGTTGTIMGCAKYLKPKGWEIIGVMPDPKCKIEGLKNLDIQRKPKIYDRKMIDMIIQMTDSEAMETMRELALKEGLLVGPSSGAAMNAAICLSATTHSKINKNIVVIFPDRGERYL